MSQMKDMAKRVFMVSNDGNKTTNKVKLSYNSQYHYGYEVQLEEYDGVEQTDKTI